MTLALRDFVVVVLFVIKSCLGSFPVHQGGQKIVEKRTKSVFVARALYCLHLWQWKPLEMVEKRTKTSFVANGHPHNEVHWSPYTEQGV